MTDSIPAYVQYVGAALFAIAVIHTFSTKFFEGLAHRQPAHAGLWHLLGEVEVVFGFWAMVLMVFLFAALGQHDAVAYIDSRNFTEPLFVFAIMVIAGTRPILQVAGDGVNGLARALPLPGAVMFYLLLLVVVPLLGSFITEPAAMTLAALLLRDRIFRADVSLRLKYVTLGVLFVNVSIGGTLTHFAAPPVLMVASTWQWDLGFMLTQFGWKAAIAVALNALGATLLFRRELAGLERPAKPAAADPAQPRAPLSVIGIHLLFLVGVVVFAHHPAVFIPLLLFFVGFATAYARYQDTLMLKEGMLVGFFLGGLVVLGGLQQWWLQPLLTRMDATAVFFGATALTAITDNAALTYLGSLVQGLSPEFKYALVAGAVSGGGLTVIANAPNPAGIALLRSSFDDGAVQPLGLLGAALLPTAVAMSCFWLL
ncbi:MAG: putative Na+/H+ antiporter [Thiomonas sp.]|uniref:putative Na+/H+ antiporter n=1 Tax=Thiomonas sp. TaxID=2047785 RepID=UPI002A3584D8|nr:putative Na+/H+ antiporter [Thiomonas sp.]MDY0331093.1 putative Na+/H+ antiporter [Thiomonas sp.]